MSKSQPVLIDLFCGVGGWSHGALAEGYHCIGFDIEDHRYGDERYPGQLVLQDVLTLDGAQFRNATLIVASPPCQEYSYMAMPWRRAKQIARALRGDDDFPTGYKGSKTITELNALFDACFRIQREASAAAGRHVPMVVENVRGAQPWVGRAKWNFGSYYLFGDVPALMPITTVRHSQKFNPDGTNHGQGSWFAQADSKNRGSKNSGGSWFNIGSPGQKHVGNNPDGRKNPGQNWSRYANTGEVSQHWNVSAVKLPSEGARRTDKGNGVRFTTDCDGVKLGGSWFHDYRKGQGPRNYGSKSSKRKAASAMIAKVPFDLARHVAAVYAR